MLLFLTVRAMKFSTDEDAFTVIEDLENFIKFNISYNIFELEYAITYEEWKVELSQLEIKHPNVYKDLKNLLLMQKK